jgi:hypothetical protein
MGWCRAAPALLQGAVTRNRAVLFPLALAVGLLTAVGFALRRRRVRSSTIDVGAVSDRWVAENRADKHDPFI